MNAGIRGPSGGRDIIAAMPRPFVRALALVSAFATAACQSQVPIGTGAIALQPNVQLAFQRHLDHERPLVFLVGADGANAYAMYCPYLECEPDPLYILAQKRCEERLGQSCRVFAEYGRVSWQGPVGRVSPGDGPVAGATVDWGGNGTLHNLKIDGLASGTATVSGKVRNAACTGAIDARAMTWRLDCPSSSDGLRANGTLSPAGADRWRGFGWSADHRPVRLFVTADVARGGPAAPAGQATLALSDQPPTYEQPGQMKISGGDQLSLRRRR